MVVETVDVNEGKTRERCVTAVAVKAGGARASPMHARLVCKSNLADYEYSLNFLIGYCAEHLYGLQYRTAERYRKMFFFSRRVYSSFGSEISKCKRRSTDHGVR